MLVMFLKYIYIFKYYLLILKRGKNKREGERGREEGGRRERLQFVVPLIYAFIG